MFQKLLLICTLPEIPSSVILLLAFSKLSPRYEVVKNQYSSQDVWIANNGRNMYLATVSSVIINMCIKPSIAPIGQVLF